MSAARSSRGERAADHFRQRLLPKPLLLPTRTRKRQNVKAKKPAKERQQIKPVQRTKTIDTMRKTTFAPHAIRGTPPPMHSHRRPDEAKKPPHKRLKKEEQRRGKRRHTENTSQEEPNLFEPMSRESATGFFRLPPTFIAALSPSSNSGMLLSP